MDAEENCPDRLVLLRPVYGYGTYAEIDFAQIAMGCELESASTPYESFQAFIVNTDGDLAELASALAGQVAARPDVGLTLDGGIAATVLARPPSTVEFGTGCVYLSARLVKHFPVVRTIMPSLPDKPGDGEYFVVDPHELSYRSACYLYGEGPDT